MIAALLLRPNSNPSSRFSGMDVSLYGRRRRFFVKEWGEEMVSHQWKNPNS
ncbi:unnamed protein product [Musa banksii]